MYYTLEGSRTMRRIRTFFFGLLLIFLMSSCGGGATPPAPATPGVDSAPTDHPSDPSHLTTASLPPICNCVLRFDHISIEHGLSQSSVQVIFQDRRGFLWFG